MVLSLTEKLLNSIILGNSQQGGCFFYVIIRHEKKLKQEKLVDIFLGRISGG